MTNERFGIYEWYGRPFADLVPEDRQQLANIALASVRDRHPLGEGDPQCPYQSDFPACSKKGGVCSIQRYRRGADGLIGPSVGSPVVVCPKRFEQANLAVRWLAEIVGFNPEEAMLAREVAFMQGTGTNKPAGKIDLVVARTSQDSIEWFGMETQAVYFSGQGMASEFQRIQAANGLRPPFPGAVRRPDWRSSSAKRLMPQLQIKVPTLRRWGSKMAVVVDRPFFTSIGGPSQTASQDLGDGDVIWMVLEIRSDDAGNHNLSRWHWEVLTLEASCDKLLAAETVQRDVFLEVLHRKLGPMASLRSDGNE